MRLVGSAARWRYRPQRASLTAIMAPDGSTPGRAGRPQPCQIRPKSAWTRDTRLRGRSHGGQRYFSKYLSSFALAAASAAALAAATVFAGFITLRQASSVR